jgi:hypothetical protein
LTIEGLFVVLGVCGAVMLAAAVQLVVEALVTLRGKACPGSAAIPKAAPEAVESSGWEARAA